MIIGVLKEPLPETRISLLPEHLATLKNWNVDIVVETDAGITAFATDEKYIDAGARVVTREEVLQTSDVILAINIFPEAKTSTLNSKVLLGNYQALFNAPIIKNWSDKGITVFSIDMIPRTTRAQSMDVLSSQANIAGYKAVLLAANLFPKYFPMFMTAAGSIPPAKVLILGAGVAGLQAIATAKRLG
ncbi:MAG TPA: NAD(P)(+) transhydrogenase (Re/Si-specific) subunit alpha, partial [Chitinophagaceae bacterium]|nr:NAD(P)(+) transhydrogenase (Re/Si-specific) subunit alpha [Chitinophagaceae bacterium]